MAGAFRELNLLLTIYRAYIFIFTFLLFTILFYIFAYLFPHMVLFIIGIENFY